LRIPVSGISVLPNLRSAAPRLWSPIATTRATNSLPRSVASHQTGSRFARWPTLVAIKPRRRWGTQISDVGHPPTFEEFECSVRRDRRPNIPAGFGQSHRDTSSRCEPNPNPPRSKWVRLCIGIAASEIAYCYYTISFISRQSAVKYQNAFIVSLYA
jgi:hypothetical protein